MAIVPSWVVGNVAYGESPESQYISGDITPSSGITSTIHWCKKRINIVEIYFEMSAGTLASGWTELGVIDEGFRPTSSFSLVSLDYGTDGAAHTQILDDGKIRVYKGSDTSNQIRVHATYIQN